MAEYKVLADRTAPPAAPEVFYYVVLRTTSWQRPWLRYRAREGIVADLQAAAARSDGEGVGMAAIIRKGNVSYPRGLEMLRSLVRAGLVEVSLGGKTRYAVTEDGFRYLAAYRGFESFARSFGVRL